LRPLSRSSALRRMRAATVVAAARAVRVEGASAVRSTLRWGRARDAAWWRTSGETTHSRVAGTTGSRESGWPARGNKARLGPGGKPAGACDRALLGAHLLRRCPVTVAHLHVIGRCSRSAPPASRSWLRDRRMPLRRVRHNSSATPSRRASQDRSGRGLRW
jgi:hypothetical protein